MRLCARYAEDVQRYGYVWGVTDMWEDQFVLAPQFEAAGDFWRPCTRAKLGGKWG